MQAKGNPLDQRGIKAGNGGIRDRGNSVPAAKIRNKGVKEKGLEI